MVLPSTPKTSVFLVALILISVLTVVVLISIPEYPAETKALYKNECNSAWKTPSATIFFFLFILLYSVDIFADSFYII